FMAHHAVKTLIVADGDRDARAWHSLASSCCIADSTTDGVTIYRAAPIAFANYVDATALGMEQLAASRLFDSLLVAADRWIAKGLPLKDLNPLQAQQQKLLDGAWLTGPIESGWSIRQTALADATDRYASGVWLGEMSDHLVGVGVYGSCAALKSIIDR